MESIRRSEANATVHLLASVWASLGFCFVAAEVANLNKFLRMVMQGRVFWLYIGCYLVLLGLGLSGLILALPDVKRLTMWKVLVAGLSVGFLAGLAAIVIDPFLLGEGFNPSLRALRDPAELLFAGVFGMGWLYGGAVAWVGRLIVERSYRHLVYFLLGCAGIGILERVLDLLARHRG